MKLRQTISLLVTLTLAVLLAACSSNSPSSNTTPPPPAITVALMGNVPTSVGVSQQTSLTATVSNDSKNGGVNWSVSCSLGANACGSFSAISTASGTATMYTAPGSVTTVTVTATAADSSSASAQAQINVTGSGTISIAFSGATPTSLNLNQQTSLTAVVSNDPKNGGVNWSVTCGLTTGTNPCGSFSAANTPNGTQVTYTAPAANTTVTITAAAADSTSTTAQIPVTITTAPLAAGNYVFQVSGTYNHSGAPLPYSVAGIFSVSSTGTITGGEQDFNNGITVQEDAINQSGSSIAATTDGNLQIVLSTCNGQNCSSPDTGVGYKGTETFDGSLYCTCKAALTEFDGGASGSGTLDLQTQPIATPAAGAGYAFAIAGAVPDEGGDVPFAMGGILDFNGTGGITTSGSVFDVNDAALAEPFPDQSFTSGAVGTVDSLGRVDITLTPSAISGLPAITLAAYIVDNTRIRLVEETDSLGGITGGSALGQGATGGFTTSGFSGQSYVVGLDGLVNAGEADTFGPVQAAGVLSAGAVNISGWVNYNDLTGTGVQAPISITGNSYTVDPTGRVTMSNINGGAGSNVSVNLQLYLTGDGRALAITMDQNDVLAGLGFAQTGKGAYSLASFNGTYALNAFGVAGGDEFDEVGPVTADGTGAQPGTLTGFVDTNWLFNAGPVVDSTVTGSYPTPIFDTTLGVFTGTTTGLDVNNPTTANDAFTYYVVGTSNSSVVVGIETDANQLTLDYFNVQQF
jgi:hypothetical protein